MSNPALIVPVNLAALIVGNDDAHGDPSLYGTKDFAAVATDFSVLPFVDAQGVPNKVGANISDAILPKPFTPVAEPLSTGVHLHWALPDALTHGELDKDTNKIKFPAAPNRWLVVRIANAWTDANAPKTACAGWIVESDHLWDQDQVHDPLPQNAMSRAVPTKPVMSPQGNKSYLTLGRVFRLSDWKGDAGVNYMSPFTALGYGLPAFAAHYDHGPNVFGFNDPLDDLDLKAFPPATSSLSYVVMGWYSNLANDPLHTFVFPKDATDLKTKTAAIEDAFSWVFPGAAAIPDRIVCNGVLRGVTWDPARRYLARRQPSDVDVAIGNTTAECVSALMAHRNPNLPDLETILNCFQLGLLERIEEPGGAADADEDLHQAAYASLSGGTIWTVQPVTPGNQDPKRANNVVTTNDDVLAAAKRTAPLDAATAPLWNDLSSKQQSYDGLAADIVTRRAQIFADWYKYMMADYPTLPSQQTPVGQQDAFTYLQQEIRDLNAQLTVLAHKQTDIDHAVDALKAKLPTGYTVVETDAPRYWEANDPVVLVAGDDARPSSRYGGDGEHDADGNLHCRLSGQTLAQLSLPNRPNAFAANALPQLTLPNAAVLPADTGALIAEAIFVDPDRAPLLAKLAGGDASVAALIKSAQQSLPGTGGVTFGGTVPSPVGLTTWSQPWIPLLLHWEVQFTPLKAVGENASSGAAYDAAFIQSNFQIDPDEIHLKPSGALPTGDYQTYQGSIVLAGNPQINLASQIDRYFKNHPDDPNAKEVEQIKDQLDFSGMAQALNGFNEQLLMRAQTLQLPVFDPLAAQRHGFMRWQFCNVTVPNAVGDENNLAAAPLAEFNPIRAGSLKVTRLRLVDAFGQVCDIGNPYTIVANDMRAPSGGTVFLPPRIAQPSRLLFRWLSAADDQVETNDHPAATPVCGWVLFNYLDTSLMVYDVDGTALGSLNVLGPLWRSAPGSGAPTSNPDVSLAHANKHLRAFVKRVMQSGKADFLTDLLGVIDKQMTTINPLGFKQNQGLSLLIGQPLALVRASLRLELQGRPLLDESWPAFAQAVKAQSSNGRASANITGVRFPVRLGDLGKLADGLIGYFIDTGAASLGPFYAGSADPGGASGVAPLDPNKIALMPVASSDESDSLKILMLADPRGSVHATTGILPVKSITIPPDMYAPTLKRLAVTFLTAPVIGGDKPIAMPLPNEQGYNWAWITHPHGTDQWHVDAEVPGNIAPGKATWPQRIEEGWLKLVQTSQDNKH